MINGILFIYHYSVGKSARNVLEHIFSFQHYSQYPVFYVNTEFGYSKNLLNMKFKVVLLHYSLFGTSDYKLNNELLRYLEKCRDCYMIAFFQDEYHNCKQRFAFLDKHKIDCVYTLLLPEYYKYVYFKYSNVKTIIHTLPGYVSDDLLTDVETYAKPDEERSIDIGYRGRRLPFINGKGSQEKSIIGIQFKELAKDLDITLDIETDA